MEAGQLIVILKLVAVLGPNLIGRFARTDTDYLSVKLLGLLRETQEIAVSAHDNDVGELLKTIDVLDHVQGEANVRTVLAICAF